MDHGGASAGFCLRSKWHGCLSNLFHLVSSSREGLEPCVPKVEHARFFPYWTSVKVKYHLNSCLSFATWTCSSALALGGWREVWWHEKLALICVW